ncbi:3-deoxy-D-manno-octulosonic acid transferase [Helicobacter sp. 12S02634-8]|uniref:lipid IV(A) 3-deoxy-D-manno-octulosonic acid transferase n=1 Tax=Helicobacter sp. 12S02634-8 TaxID=1476199 RepID=UPI000BA54F1D|nr:lipid IV(A) 3-deoxy-D-manno-octulosonic acid transferase [Helicobacter sp. 12S02634-8]PAF46540.1 3-deoxy-D-manno-octulosonic acid transferase [Helicobacter sp. 12S02634-8]
MFGVVYYLIALFFYVLSLPLLLLAALKSKYTDSIPARFFLKDFSLRTRPHFWFHACSYGEIKSLEPLIGAMGNVPILITTTTQTGYALTKQTYGKLGYIEVKFLPFEIFIPFWKSQLSHLQTLVVTEAELWPQLFMTAKKIGAKTILINARISTRSYPKYKRFAWIYKKIFACIDTIYAQESQDLHRLKALGAKSVIVFGNLKIISKPTLTASYPKSPLLTITAASTHPKEEEPIIKAFLSLKHSRPRTWLILAPRHPERFGIVENLLKTLLEGSGYTYKVFSETGFVQDCDILLVDTLGELCNLYAISDIVILGGAFAKIGGHNPIEPAFFHTKLISGPHIFNQNALFEAIEGYTIIEIKDLLATLLQEQSLPKASIKDSHNKLQILLEAIKSPTHRNQTNT